IFTFIYSLIISHGIFFGRDENPRAREHAPPSEPSFGLWLPAAVLAFLAVLFGLAPGVVDAPVVASAANTVLGQQASVPLALWHGFNLPLLMSVGVILVGLVAYAQRGGLRRFLQRIPTRLNANAVYDWSLDALTRVSEFVEGRLLT